MKHSALDFVHLTLYRAIILRRFRLICVAFDASETVPSLWYETHTAQTTYPTVTV